MTGGDNPIMAFFIGNGAFIMEQRMMNGIKARAEGWTEPPYQEPVEMVLWFVALLVGVASAVLFVARRPWVAPLTLAVASVLVVLFLTFSQPPVAVRVLLDLGLVAGFVLALRAQPHAVAATSPTLQPAESQAWTRPSRTSPLPPSPRPICRT